MSAIKRQWVIAILALVAAGVWLYKSHMEHKEDLQRNFTLKSMEQITSIELSAQSETVVLVKDGQKWLLNGEEEVDLQKFEEMQRALLHMATNAPVPLRLNDSLAAAAISNGMRVCLKYRKKNVKEYFLHYTETMELGDVGVAKNGKTVYRLSLPALDRTIASLFNAQKEYWISNQISLMPTHKVEWVQVEQPEDLEKSYRIDRTPQGFQLFDIYNGVFVTPVDTMKIQRFMESLTSFEFIDAIRLDDDNPIPLSPDFIITIGSEEKQTIVLSIHSIPVEPYTDELGRVVSRDPNHLLVTIDGHGTVYRVRFMDIYGMMRDLAYFKP